VTARYGSFIAGGSDSHCYLSQARLWTQGWPLVDEPLIAQTNGSLGRWTFIPLGYRPGLTTGTFVPICSIGYPLTMALLMRLFGAGAEMSVVPLAAAGLVFLTGWLGRRAAGDVAGVMSSLLMATSPIFLFQGLQPMSDVPAAFFWVLSAALIVSGGVWARAAVVPAVALAVLTRPNLAPLGLPLVALGLFAHPADTRRYDWTMGGMVVAGLGAGAIVVAYTNSVLFGSPAASGYGSPGSLYRLQFLWVNVQRYSGWLLETETYAVLLAAAGLVRLWLGITYQRLWAGYSSAVIAIVCASYLFYTPFGDWTYLRFLLPAFPVVFVAYASLAKHRLVTIALCAPMLAGHLYFVANHGVLGTGAAEGRYLDVANYIKGTLPENALLITAQHSGSIRYYTGRKTLRFDWLPPRELDNAIAKMDVLGYKPYIVLEDWEEPWFTSRFRRSVRGRLDWKPVAEFARAPRIRIYDPAQR